MGETNKRWRCPYCDGLNDWQNTVCEICGDGRRDEAVAAEKTATTADMPKVYVPREHEAEPAAPKGEPDREAARPTYAPPPVPELPKKKKKGGVWIAMLATAVVMLAGGYFLFGEQLGLRDSGSGWHSEVQLDDSDFAAVDRISISVRDDGMGNAIFRLQDREPKDYYDVYACYVGETPDQFNRPYNQGEANRITLPWVHRIYDSLDGEMSRRVVPGGYSRFIVHAYNDSERGVWWQSEPYWFSENAMTLPFSINDARLCKWNTDEERMNWEAVQMNLADPGSAKSPALYALNRADMLNSTLKLDRVLGYSLSITMNTDANGLSAWQSEHSCYDPAPVVALLRGPDDLCAMTNGYLYAVDGLYQDQFVSFEPLTDNYQIVKKSGGYPAGDYSVDFYVWGVKALTLRFTLT